MPIDIEAGMRNAMIDAGLAVLNVGGAGTLKTFAGAKPANCAAADPATVLSVHVLANPAFRAAGTFGEPAGQALSYPVGAAAAAENTGTPGCWRLYDHAGTCRMQGTAGIASGDLSFTTGIVQGLPVIVDSLRYIHPETGP